jgi:hypothetical protein
MSQRSANPIAVGAVQGCIPLAAAAFGMAKLGHFHWGVAVFGFVLGLFTFHNGYMRAKYPIRPTVGSKLFPQVPRKPLP